MCLLFRENVGRIATEAAWHRLRHMARARRPHLPCAIALYAVLDALRNVRQQPRRGHCLAQRAAAHGQHDHVPQLVVEVVLRVPSHCKHARFIEGIMPYAALA